MRARVDAREEVNDAAALACMLAWLAGCLVIGIIVYDGTLRF